MNRAGPIRILIADDHHIVRMGLRTVIHFDPGLLVVAESATADETVSTHSDVKPDVTLLDLRMPGGGMEALRRILAAFPGARILILTTSELEDDMHRTLTAGAAGYLLKSVPPGELAATIRAIHAGAKWIPEPIARILADRAQHPELSPREMEILPLLIKGLSNQDIATALSISHSTAKTHVARILEKLNTATRAEACAEGLRRGLVHQTDQG